MFAKIKSSKLKKDSYGSILEEEPEQQTSEFNNYTFNTSINISNLNLSQEAPCFIILENNNNELIPIVIGLDNNDLVIECMISEDLEYKGSYPDAEWKSLTYDASLEEMVDNVISEPPTISNVKILSYSEILENQNALNILTNDFEATVSEDIILNSTQTAEILSQVN